MWSRGVLSARFLACQPDRFPRRFVAIHGFQGSDGDAERVERHPNFCVNPVVSCGSGRFDSCGFGPAEPRLRMFHLFLPSGFELNLTLELLVPTNVIGCKRTKWFSDPFGSN